MPKHQILPYGIFLTSSTRHGDPSIWKREKVLCLGISSNFMIWKLYSGFVSVYHVHILFIIWIFSNLLQVFWGLALHFKVSDRSLNPSNFSMIDCNDEQTLESHFKLIQKGLFFDECFSFFKHLPHFFSFFCKTLSRTTCRCVLCFPQSFAWVGLSLNKRSKINEIKTFLRPFGG